jgi:hypothetical protein
MKRRIAQGISIYPPAVASDPWAAMVTVRRDKNGEPWISFREYMAHGDSDTVALAALKEKVKAGEGGWTW